MEIKQSLNTDRRSGFRCVACSHSLLTEASYSVVPVELLGALQAAQVGGLLPSAHGAWTLWMVNLNRNVQGLLQRSRKVSEQPRFVRSGVEWGPSIWNHKEAKMSLSPSGSYTFCFRIVCCSVAKSCLTETPWPAACQASLSFTISRSLLKLMSIVGDAVLPSHPVAPFSFCPQSFPASGSFPIIWVLSLNTLAFCRPIRMVQVLLNPLIFLKTLLYNNFWGMGKESVIRILFFQFFSVLRK